MDDLKSTTNNANLLWATMNMEKREDIQSIHPEPFEGMRTSVLTYGASC